MKILVEGCSYDPKVLEGVLPRDRHLLLGERPVVEYVGYFRSSACDDFVFFLPKVVLEPKKMQDGSWQDRVLCTKSNPYGLSPEDLIDLDKAIKDGKEIGEKERDFLYEFAVWIYRAIAHYDEMHPGSGAIVRHHEKQSGGFRRRYHTHTLLDVILALIRFNRVNQEYFMFRVKEMHSGLNRISWSRTISKTTAILQGGVPLYLDPLSKKKVVNFDEELLVIFYSILNYINKHFGFAAQINLGYELIPEAMFKRYIAGYGEARLKQIKYKYFSDRDLELWDLCFAFFSKMHKANVVAEDEEYLFAKNFEIIFEAMIDELLGDPELDDIKELDDGKVIDHLYLDESLTRYDRRKTFYIADSKYYKIGRGLERKSVAKQFTYAKDMLQLNLDLFLPGEYASDRVREWRKPFVDKKVNALRDEETEGYDVIPNFFISARMDPDFDYDKGDVQHWGGSELPADEGSNQGKEYQSVHFANRLFDRDTLILAHFDVNFLHIIKLYAGRDSGLREGWKDRTKKAFRRRIHNLIEGHYKFTAIMPHDGIDPRQFFKENLKMTLGKVYSPGVALREKPIYLLALMNPDNIYDSGLLNAEGLNVQVTDIVRENEETRALIESAFYMVDLKTLNDDPREELLRQSTTSPVVHGPSSDPMLGVQVISGVSGGLKKAVDASGFCACPIDQCPNPESIKIIVLPHTMGANLYRVVDGSLKCNVTPEMLSSLTHGAFKNVHFPSLPFYVWGVCELK